MAKDQGLPAKGLGLGRLLQGLSAKNAISPNEQSVLRDLAGLLNQAVHGEDVDPRAAQWAIEVGPRLLAGLDERVSREGNS